MDDQDKAVLDLYYWQRGGDSSSFTSMLYNLLMKADSRNSAKLALGFREHWIALKMWQSAEKEGDDLFDLYREKGVIPKEKK